jgi:hypothetical protein
MLFQVLYQGALLRLEPFDSRVDFYLSIFNESLFSLALFLFLTSSDLTESIPVKVYSGYGLLGLIGLSVTVNIGVLAIRVTVNIWNKVIL